MSSLRKRIAATGLNEEQDSDDRKALQIQKGLSFMLTLIMYSAYRKGETDSSIAIICGFVSVSPLFNNIWKLILPVSMQDQSMGHQRKKMIEKNFEQWENGYDQADDISLMGIQSEE